jgi:hypothetical protein
MLARISIECFLNARTPGMGLVVFKMLSPKAFGAAHLALSRHDPALLKPDLIPALIAPKFAFVKRHGAEYGRIGPARKP